MKGQAAQAPGVPTWGRRPGSRPGQGQGQASPNATWCSGLAKRKGMSAPTPGVLTWGHDIYRITLSFFLYHPYIYLPSIH